MLKKLLIKLLLSFAIAGVLATSALAHDAPAFVLANGQAAPLAARYAVTIERVVAGAPQVKPQRHTWYFYREAQRIALLKGTVDEVWYRDAQQRISFERVFHEDQRVVDYSTGELATLRVQADWAALSTFIDASELAQLQRVSIQGQGKSLRWILRGRVGQAQLTVDWLPALQLPQRLTRQIKGGPTVTLALVASAQAPLPNWPELGLRSAHYVHVDAADFGDMDYEPVVRKSEALDIRLGWRASHQHD